MKIILSRFEGAHRMTDWSAGYVTDIPYTYGVYRELFPAMQCFAALAAGFTAPDANAPLNYCELGCGQGYSANVVAAANPHMQVYANDFNPAHILGARNLAAAAGTGNVRFYDSSFAEFAVDETLPDFDIIAVHGVYSWINAENRRHIVDFIRQRLKVGGLVYISYNALPAYAGVMPLRRLLADRATAAAGSTAARIEQALAYAKHLTDADAAYFRPGAGVPETLKRMQDGNRDYVAHEYFNRDWTAFYHADVAADLAEAKLSYVGPADLLSGIDAINLTPEQRSLLASATTVTERETLRDYIVNQVFRRDVFVKGAVPLNQHEARERWIKTRFVLTNGRADVPKSVTGTLGEAALQPDVYDPLLDGMANGARTLEQLASDPKVAALGWDRLQQALAILVGGSQVQPALDEAGDSARLASTKAFNRAVIERARGSENWRFLASPVFGGAVFLGRTSQLFLLAREDGVEDPPAFICDLLMAQGAAISKEDGVRMETRDENLAGLRSIYEVFNDKQVPLLRAIGVA
jgi:SAM-dependent methyltransferase